MRNQKWVTIVLGAIAAVINTSAARGDDLFVKYFTDTTAIGGFSPADSDNSSFYKANFSPNAGFSLFTDNDGSWSSTTLVGPTDMMTFEEYASVNGNGSLPTLASGGTPVMGDVILNPQPLTITRSTGVGADMTTTITYPAGTLAFVIDQPSNVMSGSTTRYDLTKVGYFYDLRQVGSSANGGLDRNGNGVADLNDVFEPVFSKADMRTVAGYSGTGSGVTSHHFTFSSDGQSVYFVDSSATSVTGGLWKVNLTSTGASALQRILTANTSFNTEPSVVSSSVRSFDAGSGDQIVVSGSDYSVNPNPGGLSFVVDNGSSVSAPQTLLSAKQIQGFLETSGTPNAFATGADAAGNVYIYDSDSGEYGVFRYDTNGHLSEVFSRAEQIAFDTTTGGGSSSTATIGDMKFSTVNYTGPNGSFPITQLQYSDATSTLRAPVGVNLFAPGDFNRDGTVDTADIASLKYVLNGQDPDNAAHPSIYPRGLRGAVVASVTTSSPYTQTNPELLKYDLNGSPTVSGVAGAAIDWKDVKIFQQVYNDYQISHGLPSRLSDGDVNMDLSVNGADLTILASNYNTSGKVFTEGNITSVRISAVDKDDVNFADLVTLAANWTAAKPTLALIGNIPQSDLDRAFAITSGGTLSQYQAVGSGTWSNATNWTNGVPNAPGAVASLLTKPQNDSTITLDGTYTVGQLNFDNYFTYTLSGGTLQLQGANGMPAELNTFAASPVINSSVTVASDATATITYAADTTTLAGPLNITTGHTLTKAGPGTLRISGGISAGSLALNAGAIEVAANTTVAAFTGNGTGALNLTGSATTLKINPHAPTASAFTIDVAALSLAPGSTLDLTNNRLVVETSNSSTDSTLVSAISSAYNAGQWNASGITSSQAAQDSNHATALGYLIAPTSFTAAYTWYGDANLDGKIDADDYVLIDRGFSKHLTNWSNGDFDYNGIIDSNDYLLIDRVFALTHGGSLSPALLSEREAEFGSDYVSELIAAVPEPAMFSTLLIMMTGSMLRRSRNRFPIST